MVGHVDLVERKSVAFSCKCRRDFYLIYYFLVKLFCLFKIKLNKKWLKEDLTKTKSLKKNQDIKPYTYT